MKEFNKKTLIEALSKLPEYEPPDSIWSKIQERVENEDFLRLSSFHELPSYYPPESVWNRIVDRLDRPVVNFIFSKRVLAVAASVLLLVVAGLLLDTDSTDKEEYLITFSTEEVDPLLTNHNWLEDEEAFEEFDQMCKSRSVICSQPEFIQLKSDLEELTDAKNSLVTAIGKYGHSADMIIQLKDIELERTDLLKKLMVMLI